MGLLPPSSLHPFSAPVTLEGHPPALLGTVGHGHMLTDTGVGGDFLSRHSPTPISVVRLSWTHSRCTGQTGERSMSLLPGLRRPREDTAGWRNGT